MHTRGGSVRAREGLLTVEVQEPTGKFSLATLDYLMEHWCRKLAFLAVSPAQRIEGSETARVKPGSTSPRPVEDLAGAFRSDYERAKSRGASTTHLLEVVKGAQDAWLAVAYGPAPERVRGTLDWKIAVASDQRPSHVVARAYGISPSYVRKLRGLKREGRLSKTSQLRVALVD
jgi:hypothetical protein